MAAPALADFSIIFDDKITKVEVEISFSGTVTQEEVTNSGGIFGANSDFSTDYIKLTPIFVDGYELNTFSITSEYWESTVSGDSITFVPTSNNYGSPFDATITSKLATPTISFKHRFKNDTLIGTGTYKFRRYSQTEPVVTEHTLTFSGGVTVTVDGASVTSPYTLTKDCTIVANSPSPGMPTLTTPPPSITVNGQTLTAYGETISISKTDITITGTEGDTELSITINYTA